MGLCHGKTNSTNEQSNPNENLDSYMIIWLDDNKQIFRKNQSIQSKLRTIINHLKLINNENECEELLKRTSENEFIVFIVNDQIGEKIIPRIHNLEQIFSIYIYSSNKKNIDQRWMSQYHKIKSFCINENELVKQIETDQIKSKDLKSKILFDLFHTDKPINFNQNFIFSQILIDILLQMDSMPNDRSDFITLCRNHFKGNKTQLDIIYQFQKNYTPDDAVWWFTRDTFISHLLNKAIRVQNIELLFFLRFFLHDIERQLQKYRCLTAIETYKYEFLTTKEFSLLKDSIGQFISINNFLLTKLDRDHAIPSTKSSFDINDYQAVLLKITTNSHIDKTEPFANIKLLNYFSTNDDEILFMLGSIFQIDDVYQDDNDLWVIHMTLSNRINTHLRSIFKHYKNDDDDDDDNLSLLSFGCILEKMNKLDEAKKFYCRLLNELSDDDDRIGICLLNLGNIDFIKNDYDASLDWLLKSLDFSLRTLQSNDTFFARIYYSLGHLYNAKTDTKSAIESYEKAIIIWKQSTDDYYLNIAECMNNIGIMYKHENNYLIALDYFKKTLHILEKYVLNDDFDISKCHCNIANTYRHLEEYDLALEHYTLSLKILEKLYPSDDLNIAKSLGNIGIIYTLKKDNEKALSYYEKAALIYRQTLPPTHINNIKIDQLIRNVSTPSRKVSFGGMELTD